MTDPQSIKILSVDDHPLLREGIAAVIDSEPDMTIVARASTARELRAYQNSFDHLFCRGARIRNRHTTKR
jgi:DNA-binding NarL/FixJ family response regulator